MKRWALLGASRGLGRSFLEKARAQGIELQAFSRKIEAYPAAVKAISQDFSKEGAWPELIRQIEDFAPERIFYFAAGGPYGSYQQKNWADHEWAFRVSYACPAFLLHYWMRRPQQIQQVVFIGSAIAENQADPRAASYCAAKHALKGLVTSIQAEESAPFDLRLWSPGYLDTLMLPAHAWPRQQAGLVQAPREAAEMLWAWIHNADDANGHFVLKSST